ncbi:MAG TPA: permease, partial [Phycisphaerae bacterium]|nr:permease [Phycisphaerae bacterium]
MLDTTVKFFSDFWTVLEQMSPYLLFGFILAGIIRVLLPVKWIERHLGGEGFWASLKSSAIGVPLPVCSCGVIPLAASLRKHGAGAGPTTAFLISTPQTGVDSILATWAMLGPVFTIFRVAAALLSGLLGGWAVSLLVRTSTTDVKNHTTDNNHDDELPKTVKGKISEAVRFAFVTLPGDLAGALMVGLIISGLISALIPDKFFAQHLSSLPLQMLLMLAMGIPMYVCSTASIPIAAALVLSAGISPGAALVFLMSGPATNAATITIITRMLGWRAMITYLASVAVTSIGAGILMDTAFSGIKVSPMAMHQHGQGVSIIYTIAAVILLAMLLI